MRHRPKTRIATLSNRALTTRRKKPPAPVLRAEVVHTTVFVPQPGSRATRPQTRLTDGRREVLL